MYVCECITLLEVWWENHSVHTRLQYYRSQDNEKSFRILCRLEIFWVTILVVAIAVVVDGCMVEAAAVTAEDTSCVGIDGGGV
jgi:hypothetical protein